MANKVLLKAKKAKKDEFYTQLDDIENELSYYRDHFKGKVVYCNADDPYESNFFKYFAMNFNVLGLKKLIATSYSGSPIVGQQLTLFDIAGMQGEEEKRPLKIEIKEVKDYNGDGAVDLSDVEFLLKNDKNTVTPLKGNGDFRSEECVELLKEADIVVTNPPFSLFREYIAQLIEYDKKFIVLGNKNAVTYKEVFPLLRDRKVWPGVSRKGENCLFEVPDHYKKYSKIINGKKYALIGVIWFTNIDHGRKQEKLDLYKKYYGNEQDYPKYENYDAINVDKTIEIPVDYDGVMGVPISFINKWNPDQFELIGCREPCIRLDILRKKPKFKEYKSRQVIFNGVKCQKTYHRLFIKRKNSKKVFGK